MALEIVEKESHGATLLVLSGQVKIGEESNRLRDKLRELLGKGKTCLVLDLGDVDYIDSSGLGTIAGLYVSARTGRCEFALINANEQIRELLGISNLLKLFEAAGRHGGRIV